MTDDKTPVEQALDVLIYAPVGLVFSARELLPKLAEKGRAQMGMAKMLGQFAVQQGQKDANRAFGKAREQAMATLEQLSALAPTTSGSRSAGNGSATADISRANASAPVIDIEVVTTPAPVAPAAPTSGPEAAGLAIPDYDSLSASQVLPRLHGLGPADLEEVRAYEAAHRGRKTILNRVTQLQSS